MLSTKQPAKIGYRENVGWVVTTSVPLTEEIMRKLILWAQEYYTHKLFTMSPGKTKDKLASVVKELYDGQIIEEIEIVEDEETKWHRPIL